MAAPTAIGLPPRVSVLGPPPNFDKVTKIGTGYVMASNTPGAIGEYGMVELRVASVAISQTSLVLDAFIAPARIRIVNYEIFTQTITATATVLLYNLTQTANVAASVTPTTTPVIVTTFTTPLAEANDVIQLLGTTNGSGLLTNVVARITFQYLSAPSNAQS